MNDDLISRKAAREAVNDVIVDYIPTLFGRLQKIPLELARAIVRLPAAEPRTGEWLDDCGGMACSCCGFSCDDPYYLGKANYCPNCGAKMEESDG